MARIALFSFVCIGLLVSNQAHGAKPKVETAKFEGWTNNFEEALAASQASGKPILLFFTGSDWCGHCKRLKGEVFETPEFQAWANEKVILMEVDFPRQTPQPEALQQQNATLRGKFRDITGFPSIRFVSSTGDLIGSMGGYSAGTGPEKWIASATAKLTGKPEPIADPAKPASNAIDAPYPIFTSYSEGLTAAKKEGRPLLLVLSKTGGPEKLQANLVKLLTDEQFAKFAENGLSVSHVKEPVDKESEDDTALAELRKENRLSTTPIQLLLIDPSSGKVLLKSVVLPNAKAFVLQLQKKVAALEKNAS